MRLMKEEIQRIDASRLPKVKFMEHEISLFKCPEKKC